MAKWFGQNEDNHEEDAGKAVEAKFGALETNITELKTTQEATKNTLESLASTISAINDRFKNEDQLRAERERKAKETQAQNNQRTPEEEFEAFAANPSEYVKQHSSGAAQLSLLAIAKQVRQETLGDKEYYYGEFKKKVDALIEAEPRLDVRANPAFLNNCYKVILADHVDEISKGSLKKNSALHSFQDSNSGGGNKGDETPKVDYRDSKTKFAASQFGLTDDDIVKAAKEGVIHGLEVVA